jgi:hypothetical protein
MAETAISVPFDSGEIKEIAVAEFRKRLDQLSPLQGAKEYGAFEIDFAHTIRLHRTSGVDTVDKQTLAWGHVEGGKIDDVPAEEAEKIVAPHETYKSDPDVNGERLKHDMPLTIETKDGKGNRVRKRVHVSDDGK